MEHTEREEELDKAIAEEEVLETGPDPEEVDDDPELHCALCGELLIDCECEENVDDEDEEEDNEEKEDE